MAQKFNYVKAFFKLNRALLEDKNLTDKYCELLSHSHVCLAKSRQQQGNLRIPLADVSKEFDGLINNTDSNTLAAIAYLAHAIEHYTPSPTARQLTGSLGSAWKLANILDQYLSKRYSIPLNPAKRGVSFFIHEGCFRIGYATQNEWRFEEFSLATEDAYSFILNNKITYRKKNAEKLREYNTFLKKVFKTSVTWKYNNLLHLVNTSYEHDPESVWDFEEILQVFAHRLKRKETPPGNIKDVEIFVKYDPHPPVIGAKAMEQASYTLNDSSPCEICNASLDSHIPFYSIGYVASNKEIAESLANLFRELRNTNDKIEINYSIK